jgi:hypothetical protein
MDDDDGSYQTAQTIQQENDAPPLPPIATPEDDQNEAQAAAAEVAAMERPTNRGRDPTADEALMGAAPNEDGVAGFEIVDESGELVRQAFLQFLSE